MRTRSSSTGSAGDTVAYRASDKAGNTSEARQVSFSVIGGAVPAPPCAELDERETVFVGEEDSGVPNRITSNRCRINERIEDEREWSSNALFLKHVETVLTALGKEGVIDKRETRQIRQAAKASGIGKPGQTEGYRKLFDGTEKSFAQWEQAGGGAFALNEDGSMTSSTEVEGMGMLWFPERKYDDFSLKLQWRDDAPEGGNANAGVFARFPTPTTTRRSPARSGWPSSTAMSSRSWTAPTATCTSRARSTASTGSASAAPG